MCRKCISAQLLQAKENLVQAKTGKKNREFLQGKLT
jgi:hypothetical protein